MAKPEQGGEEPSVEFRVLGPLVVLESDVEITIRAAKQRALLAMLLLRRGELVSTVALVEGLWGGRPPASAVKTVQVYIAELRKLLGKELIDRARRIRPARRPPIERAASTSWSLTGRHLFGGGKTGVARERLGEALALWRGPPLAEFVSRASCVTRSAGSKSCGWSRANPYSRASSRSAVTPRLSPSSRRLSVSSRCARASAVC